MAENPSRKNWFGLLAIVLAAVPAGAWGITSILTQRHDTTSRLGGVTHEVGAQAVASGILYLAMSCALLSVAAAQWPHIRKPAIACIAISVLTAIITFGWKLSH